MRRQTDDERPLNQITVRVGANILDSVKTEFLRNVKEAFMRFGLQQRETDGASAERLAVRGWGLTILHGQPRYNALKCDRELQVFLNKPSIYYNPDSQINASLTHSHREYVLSNQSQSSIKDISKTSPFLLSSLQATTKTDKSSLS